MSQSSSSPSRRSNMLVDEQAGKLESLSSNNIDWEKRERELLAENSKLLAEVKKLSATTKDELKTITFSKATLEAITSNQGLNLDMSNVNAQRNPSICIPSNFPASVASACICENLAKIVQVWILNNEKSQRLLIDAILTEVLFLSQGKTLRGFCEVRNDWEGSGIKHTGTADYMIGSFPSRTAQTVDSFLLVIEAKKEWPDEAVHQVLCEAGCLLKNRQASGHETPVFAVLTNGTSYRFYAIDTDCVVYSSGHVPICLKPDPRGDYSGSESLQDILRWFAWILDALESISPRVSDLNLTEGRQNQSLARLRECFGLIA
jgi:hypothetical protein